jgi:glycosyltransferase involved in cell wall biosynthesis
MTSIITIVKNHKHGLCKTLDSIGKLEEGEFEVILVVGESLDGTLQVAKDFVTDSSVDSVLICQEGSGIYEAMNLGIQAAKGNSMIFMNAGDCFESPTSLRKMQYELETHNVGVVIGGYVLDGYGSMARVSKRARVTPLGFAFNRRGGCHQAMLYRSSAINHFGGYPIRYRLAADFDLTLRIIATFEGLRVPILVALIEPGGVADKGIIQVHNEKHFSRKENFNKTYIIVYSLFWCLAAKSKIKTKIMLHKIFG